MIRNVRSLAVVVLGLLAVLHVYSGCSGTPASPSSQPVALNSGGPLLQEQGYGCVVALTGPSKTCLDCDDKTHPVIVLTATGTPPNGTYQWKAEPDGRVLLKQGNENKNRASVEGLTQSVAPNDVTVTVTYTAPGVTETCSATHQITVVKPDKLEVVSDHHFRVVNGVIAPPPGPLGRFMPPVKAGDVGSILIRFYKVLDQFGAPWTCNGELTEEIVPDDGISHGGTPVTNGLPKNPDRLYRVGDPTDKNKPVTFPLAVTQTIKVSGCLVRTNTVTYTQDAVVMAP